MKHICSILLPLYKDLGLEEKLILQEIESRWHIFFGSPLCLHTCPIDLKDGELLINVDSPVWLQQLKFMQPMIIQKLGEYPVKSLNLRLGKVKKNVLKKDSAAAIKTSTKPSASLSAEDDQWLNHMLSSISDTEIKESIKKAVQNSLNIQLKKSARKII